MKARQKRLLAIVIGLTTLTLAAVLVFNTLNEKLDYFFSPTEVAEGKAPKDHLFRLGGLVEKGSLQRGKELTVRFVVTDLKKRINVSYTGILPDLFQEGQGVITRGRLGPNGEFVADEVLAKHDENYMPPEVAAALEKSGNSSGEKQ